MPSIWDTHELLRSEGLGQPHSSALPSEIQTACLVGSGWFPSTPAAVLGGHLRAGAMATEAAPSSLPLSRDFDIATWCGASASLHDPLDLEFLLRRRLHLR